MATFSGKPALVNRPAGAIAAKFADLTAMQALLDEMPAEERAKVGDVRLTSDEIIINTPQVGAITLRVTERSPELVRFDAVGAPVPMAIKVTLKPLSADTTEVASEMDVDIPMFLRPMIGGALQKAADQFGALMSRLA